MMYKHQTFGWSLVTLSGRRTGRVAKWHPCPSPGPCVYMGVTQKYFQLFRERKQR